LEQTLHVTRQGSVLQGSISAGCSGVDVRIEIDSDESPDRVRHLVRLTQESCFTHGALARPVPVTASIILNGAPVSLEEHSGSN
jgi:hypothetical protein